MASITYTIPDEKVSEFMQCFLLAEPKPSSLPEEEPMPDAVWVKLWGKNKFQQAYKKGKKILVTQQTDIDKEIIG